METLDITYHYRQQNGNENTFRLSFDEKNFLLTNTASERPQWTELEFNKCGFCDGRADEIPHCPLAVALIEPVKVFGEVLSYEEMEVEVHIEERTVTFKGQAQDCLSPLLGLLGATSGCPILEPLRPMARFHLPFATPEETVYRAASMYALGQYYRKKAEKYVDIELQGLRNIYQKIADINRSMAERLRAGAKEDSTLNAIVLLDILGKSLPIALEDSLEDFEGLFCAYT